MKRFLLKVRDWAIQTIVISVCMWIVFAILFDLFFIYLHFTNPKLSEYYSNLIMDKLYGLY